MTSYQKLKAKIAQLEEEKQKAERETMMLAYPEDYNFMDVTTVKMRCSLKHGFEQIVWSGDMDMTVKSQGYLGQVKQ